MNASQHIAPVGLGLPHVSLINLSKSVLLTIASNIQFAYGPSPIPALTCPATPREPLSQFMASLAYRLVRNQGATLKTYLGLLKSRNAECGPAGKPRRARPEAHICGVALLAKGDGHSLRSAPCICTLQVAQRRHKLAERLPVLELPSNHSYGYGLRSSPASRLTCPASTWPRPVSRPVPGLIFSGRLVQYAG
jgi:hypothetical protein